MANPDAPRDLGPGQVALPAQVARGALIALPTPDAKKPPKKTAKKTEETKTADYEVLRFQYNPETVTRARTGQWERKLDKKAAKAAQDKNADDAGRGGTLKSKSEVISFKLVFDAAELLMSINGDPTGQGILPELAVLERFALGPDQIPDPPKKDNEFALESLVPTEALLVLGPRKFPGVVTQMNIVEQRFNTQLVPIRAEIDVRFRVLEAAAVAVNKDTAEIFQALLEERRKLAQDPAYGFTSDSLNNAITKAVAPRTAGGGK